MPIFSRLKEKMHPVHVVLVHFPSALYPFSLVMDALGIYYANLVFSASAYYALLFAFLSSLLAAVFGAIDYLNLKAEHKAFRTASIHGGLNVLWMLGFGVAVKLRHNFFSVNELPSIAYLMLMVFLVIGVAYSNHLGGDLVFKYGIGVKRSTPPKDTTTK